MLISQIQTPSRSFGISRDALCTFHARPFLSIVTGCGLPTSNTLACTLIESQHSTASSSCLNRRSKQVNGLSSCDFSKTELRSTSARLLMTALASIPRRTCPGSLRYWERDDKRNSAEQDG